MKKLLLIATFLLFSIPTSLFAQSVNIELNRSGQIGEIYYNNISRNYRSTILAQLVSDDVIKKAISLADANKFHDALQLLSSITYLDYNNKNVVSLSSSYLKELIISENDKTTLYKNFMSEAKAALKQNKTSHNIDFERGLLIANEAMSLYKKDTEEYKNANDIAIQFEKLIRKENPSQEILNRLLIDATKAAEQGNHIRAINKFAILFFAENSTLPLVEIVKLLKLVN